MIDILSAAEIIAQGQQRTARLVDGMLGAGRMPSSMLFSGPGGAGKELMAVRLAARLNCIAPDSCSDSVCSSCRKTGRLEHPDLHLVYPLPSGPAEKSMPVIVESRREDFLAHGEFGNKARSIGIGAIRKLLEVAGKQPFEGKYMPVILFEAHLATIEAQNAFLKLLEEPPASVVLIIVTGYPDRLLPTILSRCREIRFDLLGDSSVSEFLETFYSVEKSEAGRLASLAGGSIRRAVDFLDERFLGLRNDAVSALKLVLEGKTKQMPAEAEGLAREYTREETGILLQEMVTLNRQMLRAREGRLSEGETKLLKKEFGGGAIESAMGRDLPEDMRKIAKASERLKRNVDIELTWIQLLLDLAGKWY